MLALQAPVPPEDPLAFPPLWPTPTAGLLLLFQEQFRSTKSLQINC